MFGRIQAHCSRVFVGGVCLTIWQILRLLVTKYPVFPVRIGSGGALSFLIQAYDSG